MPLAGRWTEGGSPSHAHAVQNFLLRARKLWTIGTEPSAREAFRRGRIAPSVELRPLLAALGDVQTVVDVGANVGQFSLLCLMDLSPRRVFAFEPLRRPAGVFEQVFADRPEVTLQRIAIGDMEGCVDMHVTAADDSSSLLPITAKQTGAFPGTGEVGTEAVQVRQLSSVLAPEDIAGTALLKLDVQGYELAVLRGAEAMLGRFDWVLAELSFTELYEGQPLADEVLEWLHHHRYRVAGVANSSTIQADFLFHRCAD